VPRNYKNVDRRRFDTRLNFKQMCRLLGITPLQRVKLLKYMKEVGILNR